MQRSVLTAARATDGLASILFIAILSISVPPLNVINPKVTLLSILLPTLWYLFTMVVKPIWRSQPLHNIQISNLDRISKIRFRVSDKMPTRALDLILARYVVINRQDLEGHYQDWRALIGHELEHLRNGDARFFHFAGVTGLIALISLALNGLVFLSHFSLPASEQASSVDSARLVAIWFPIAFLGAVMFFLLWLRSSLHEREYLADKAGREMFPAPFDDWLRRGLRKEKRANVRAKELPARLLKWFTHPTFSNRSARATSSQHKARFRLMSDVFRSVVFLYGSGFLAYLVYKTAGQEITGDYASDTVIYGYLTVIALTIAAGLGAISIANQDALRNGGLRYGLLFAFFVCALNWGAVYFYYSLSVGFGWHAGLTADLPMAPDDDNSVGYLAFLVIIGNFSMSLLVLNTLIWKLVGRFRFNIFLHILIGLFAILGGFVFTKVQWWLLT